MKKYIITFTTLIAIAFTACAAPKKGRQTKVKPAKTAISSISISRGPCFGRCPSYTLTVENNGKASYQGRTFAPYQGVYERKFTPAQVTSLFTTFTKYRVDTCKGDYHVDIPDLPGLDIILTVNGKEKRINNAGFGPEFLRKLAEMVDKTAKIDDSWQKISNLEEQ